MDRRIYLRSLNCGCPRRSQGGSRKSNPTSISTNLVAGLLLLVFLVPRASAEAPIHVPPAPTKPVEAVLTTQALISLKSEKWGADANIMARVIQCESQGNQYAVGDNGTSFGLVQIHLPAHPNITKEQAFDKEFSIDYLAQALSRGKGDMWTCYRLLTKTTEPVS